MTVFNRTYREVDGERVEGTWRHAFIRNGDYFLTDLKIYADGMVDCWGLVNLTEFAAKVRSGWVATTLPAGAKASVHELAQWTFDDPHSWIDADELIGEVADEVERLAGRPDARARCRQAVDACLAEPTEQNRDALRAAYLAIPAHLRVYTLGDMDYKDRPIVALFDDDEQERAWAVEYFARCEREREASAQRRAADGPEEPQALPVTFGGIGYPGGWPAEPGLEALQNRYPAPIVVAGITYPTVEHAYWALSTSDETARADIAAAETAYRAAEAARDLPRRPGWSDARLAVMTGLLRAKFRQHPHLGDLLLTTQDAKLLSNEHFSRFWGPGRGWVGRLLEVVRAELAAERAGITDF
ncbi:NADAR family protein [Nocardia brasiliensis]|uniref:NADAR family protein n=1 Tax=Nocardia brasiliensis TaxID=37326 RepID=UPI001894BBF9|nr:NADAR family protein [Nocardia brasiliensis]MBF6129467.1 NADAR family protein [Nocardia brasiliensis]